MPDEESYCPICADIMAPLEGKLQCLGCLWTVSDRAEALQQLNLMMEVEMAEWNAKNPPPKEIKFI